MDVWWPSFFAWWDTVLHHLGKNSTMWTHGFLVDLVNLFAWAFLSTCIPTKHKTIGGHGKGSCKIGQFSYWCQTYTWVFNRKYCTLSFIWILHVGFSTYFYHPRNPIESNLCTLWGVLFAQGASGRNPHNSSPYPQRVRGISTERWKNARGNHAKSKASGRSWYAAASKRPNPEP